VAEAIDLVHQLARHRYGNDLNSVDAESITLSDGSQLFLAKLLVEMAGGPEANRAAVAEAWFGAFDAFRQRISQSTHHRA